MKLEWADYAVGNSSENTLWQWSQLTEPLWTDTSLNSEISVLKLISTKEGKKKKGAGGQ